MTVAHRPEGEQPITFEPIHDDDAWESGIAYELNQMADGLDDTAVASAVSNLRPRDPTPPCRHGRKSEFGCDCIGLRASRSSPPTLSRPSPRPESPESERSFVCGFGDRIAESDHCCRTLQEPVAARESRPQTNPSRQGIRRNPRVVPRGRMELRGIHGRV